MIKAPTPLEVKNFENSESIQIENNENEKFKLTISYNSNYIQFQIEDLISFPKKEYILNTSLEELQKINRYFLFFQSTQETSQILIKSSKNKNLFIINENNIYKIKIINPVNGEEFSFAIPKKEIGIKEQLEIFTPLMNKMSKKIDILEKDNKELRQKISELEKRLSDLEKQNNNISDANNLNQITANQMFKSNIINKNNERVILNWIPKKILSTELIFDTSRDGDSIDDFKNKCEGKCPTLVIVKTNTGFIFGGYATSPWKENGPIEDYNSFTFSLDPDKKFKVIEPKCALWGYRYNDIMFQFGNCYFRISQNCTKSDKNFFSICAYENGLIDIIKDDNFIVGRLEIFKLNF